MGYVNICGTPKELVYCLLHLKPSRSRHLANSFGPRTCFKKARDSGEAEERVEDVHHRGERGVWPSVVVISSLGIEFRSLLGSRLLLGFRCNYHEYFTFLVGDGRISRVP